MNHIRAAQLSDVTRFLRIAGDRTRLIVLCIGIPVAHVADALVYILYFLYNYKTSEKNAEERVKITPQPNTKKLSIKPVMNGDVT